MLNEVSCKNDKFSSHGYVIFTNQKNDRDRKIIFNFPVDKKKKRARGKNE